MRATRCTFYFDTQLHGILPWADIDRNGNIFFCASSFFATHDTSLMQGHRKLRLAEDFEMLRLTADFEILRLTCDFKTLRLTPARHPLDDRQTPARRNFFKSGRQTPARRNVSKSGVRRKISKHSV